MERKKHTEEKWHHKKYTKLNNTAEISGSINIRVKF